MTFAENERIFSKECISNQDLMKIFEVCSSTASTIMNNIKLKSDRLKIKGKCHVQDYFDFFDIDASKRYTKDHDEVDYTAFLRREDKIPHVMYSPR